MKWNISSVDVLTMKVLEMDGQPVGLFEAFAAFPADIRLVSRVRADVTRQLNGLSKWGRAVLTAVHFTCKWIVMLVSTCATVYMIYAWYKTEEPSHPPHASSWCGMRVRQPQKSSCHSVCSGRVFLLCVDACGSSETRWQQTSPHTPRMRRVSPRNVQCVYDIKDLKDISTEHIKQCWQKSEFCVQKCPSSPFTYLF